MPAHWKDWENAKRDVKEAAATKRSAVDEALSIVRGAQKASREDPNTMRCPACGGVKFKTVSKGLQWACRSCGTVVAKKQDA
jgi:ribosomal protein L37AE/L43A